MKQLIFLFVGIALFFHGSAQNITRLEYFVDGDPGIGNATPVSLPNESMDEYSFSVDLNTLEDGIHKLYYRVRDTQGNWSQTYNRVFVKTADDIIAPRDSVVFEYYFDEQTALLGGKTTFIDTATWDGDFSLNASVEDLEQGIHKLYYRFRGKNGHWSQTYSRVFVKTHDDVVFPCNPVVFEYYFDEQTALLDGKTTFIDTAAWDGDFSLNAPVEDLEQGIHKLYYRFRGKNGLWSQTYSRTFLKERLQTDSAPGIEYLEYHLNENNGFGNGVSVDVSEFQGDSIEFVADITGLTDSNRIFVYVRDEFNRWSYEYLDTFYVETAGSLTADFTADTTAGEAPLEVHFTDQSAGYISDWSWDFDGDGTEDASEQHPTHVYNQPGVYTVSLTVRDSVSSDIKTRTDYIVVSGSSSGATVAGNVTDATNGEPVAGAIVSIDSLSDITDSYGNYEIAGVPLGSLDADFRSDVHGGGAPLTVQFYDESELYAQTLTATADDYIDYVNEQVTIDSIGTFTQNISMSPTLGDAVFRMVLNWSSVPSDLDAHLKTPDISGSSYHVYWMDQGSSTSVPYATLDYDVTTGYGPETMSIYETFSGTYHFYIKQFSDNGALTSSGASVQIYNAEGNSQAVQVPTTGTGIYWHVCDIDGATNEVNVVNQIVENAPFIAKGGKESKSETGKNSITSYLWDFGDGKTSSSANPQHVYDAEGFYTVSLSIMDEDDNTDTEIKTDYINVSSTGTLHADFTADITEGEAPLEVHFTDQSAGYISDWSWDFDGDGTEDASEQHPTHVYNQPGVYTVSLTVSDSVNSETSTRSDYILVYESGSLAADFTADDTSGNAPLEVSFTDESTGDIIARGWDFDGDGVFDSESENPVYVYEQPGTYTVLLAVSDGTSTDTKTRSDYITVYEAGETLAAKFTADNTIGNAPLEVNFTDESTGDIVSRAWDFDGDGTWDSNAENPEYIYEQPGTYTVILSVSDGSDMDTQTRNDFITVYSEASLQADFMADTTSGPAPLKVHFTDQSTGNITSWKWDFYGNGEVDTTVQHPVYEFREPGEYTVRLTVSDGSNSDTETKQGYIEVKSSTSIINPVAEHTVKVFPNPSSGRFGIYIENYTEVKRLEILSLEGIRINKYTREELSKDLMFVNFGEQSSGVYLLIIYFENEIITRKMIKN